MANEKRLIDANALSIQVMDASYWDNQDEDVIWNLVQDAPTVDAVEVVRCKDCKHREDGMCPMESIVYYPWEATKDDDFCSYGERKYNERKAD